MTLSWALTGLWLTGASAFAEDFRSRNEVDLGFTDNAYLTKDDRKSDSYLYASTSNTWSHGEHALLLRLSYREYFVEKPNNLLSWRAGDRLKLGRWNVTGALVGQNYTAGSPGTTDNSFNNFGADASAETDAKLTSKVDWSYGGGLRVRSFPGFNGRLDHTGFASARLERQINPQLLLSGFAEAGLLISSLSEYSRLYFDVGAVADQDLGADWTWTSELSIGQSYFLNRPVSTPVAAVNRRGVRVTTTNTANERFTNLLLSTGALRRQSEQFRWGGEINYSTQSSLSTYQDYSALALMGRLIWIF